MRNLQEKLRLGKITAPGISLQTESLMLKAIIDKVELTKRLDSKLELSVMAGMVQSKCIIGKCEVLMAAESGEALLLNLIKVLDESEGMDLSNKKNFDVLLAKHTAFLNAHPFFPAAKIGAR